VTLNDIELAIAAVDAGAAVVRAMYGGQLTQFERSPTDFATDADVEAERVILNLLRAARPDDQLVGEESGTSADGASGRTWLVDPLCGTLNYAAQTPLVAVNVALRINGQITAAVSADPFSRELFWTDGTRGCLRLDHAWITPETVDAAAARSTAQRLTQLPVAHLLPGRGKPVHHSHVWASKRG